MTNIPSRFNHSCDQCSLSFQTETELTEHIATIHNEEQINAAQQLIQLFTRLSKPNSNPVNETTVLENNTTTHQGNQEMIFRDQIASIFADNSAKQQEKENDQNDVEMTEGMHEESKQRFQGFNQTGTSQIPGGTTTTTFAPSSLGVSSSVYPSQSIIPSPRFFKPVLTLGSNWNIKSKPKVTKSVKFADFSEEMDMESKDKTRVYTKTFDGDPRLEESEESDENEENSGIFTVEMLNQQQQQNKEENDSKESNESEKQSKSSFEMQSNCQGLESLQMDQDDDDPNEVSVRVEQLEMSLKATKVSGDDELKVPAKSKKALEEKGKSRAIEQKEEKATDKKKKGKAKIPESIFEMESSFREKNRLHQDGPVSKSTKNNKTEVNFYKAHNTSVDELGDTTGSTQKVIKRPQFSIMHVDKIKSSAKSTGASSTATTSFIPILQNLEESVEAPLESSTPQTDRAQKRKQRQEPTGMCRYKSHKDGQH